MEFSMKKIQIIMCLLILSPVWAQKENSRNENNPKMLSDEKINGAYTEVVDAKLIQQIRMIKQNKEKAFMKKQILNGERLDSKTFKVSNSESKYLALKDIIESIKSSSKITRIEKLTTQNKNDTNVFDETLSKNILENKKNKN
tara:strand:+ start:1094 stop:1522 length:429 start_codon:yes stop_codon:yes gene_type:complete